MTLGVTFPENEDEIDFGSKNEMLVLLVTKLSIYIKLGNYSGNLLRKCTTVHYRNRQVSRKRNAAIYLGSWALKQGILTKKMRHDKFRQILGYLSS